VSADAFDVKIRPLYAKYEEPIPMCLEIVPKLQTQSRDYPVSLIVLADVSGSMLDGTKIQNLRDGIMRIGELSNRFASLRTELSIIEFNDSARVVFSSADTPSEKQLKQVCESLTPSGGTNIGAALEMGIGIAIGKKAAHIVLFTDGEDSCNLGRKLEANFEPYIKNLGILPDIWLHCVGICTRIDAHLLDTLRNTARRGTFQTIRDNNITKLMGALWGLMIEAVDPNCTVSVTIDGNHLHRQEAILRIPGAGCRILVPSVPLGRVQALLSVGDTTKEATFHVSDGTDEVCAMEVVDRFQADTFSLLAKALDDYDLDAADVLNDEAIRNLETMFRDPTPGLSEHIEAAIRDLRQHKQVILDSRDADNLAREASLCAMSRASTIHSNGASLDPTSRALSDLQTQLLD
jgi:hypothetical protein